MGRNIYGKILFGKKEQRPLAGIVIPAKAYRLSFKILDEADYVIGSFKNNIEENQYGDPL